MRFGDEHGLTLSDGDVVEMEHGGDGYFILLLDEGG